VRIRSIKPEYWRSADITSLDIPDRFLFIGLWSYVDDNGVGIDDDAAIIGDLFARDMFRDSRETVARVSRGLSNLFTAGLIVRYSIENKRYLYITNWEKHQRIDKPGRERFPRPDGNNAVLATPSRESRETLAPGTGEQGNRGTGEQVLPAHPAAAHIDEMFNRFWTAWPLKKGKKEARTAFDKAIKSGATLEDVLAGVGRYTKEIGPTPDWSKVKWAQGWLNGARWEDESLPTGTTRQVPKDQEWMYR